MTPARRATRPPRSFPGTVVATLALSLLAGCVTQGTYDEMQAERDALQTRVAALEAHNDEIQSQADRLETHVAELENANQALDAKLAERAAEAERLKGTYDALVSDLESELVSGKVQIQQLQSGGLQLDVGSEVLFPSGSADLDAGGQRVLEKVASELSKSPNRIVVEGHTDDVGISPSLRKRYATNWELAAARACRVVRLFQESGIAGDRLHAVSAGPFQPNGPNDTPAGRARNRRIEIRLLPALESRAAERAAGVVP